MNKVDPVLQYLTARKTRRRNGLSAEEVLAINVFWRDKVKLSTLARAFGVSKNTIHYRVVNGSARSYPKGFANSADDTNALVEEVGVEEIRRRFVTPEMVAAVDAAMTEELAHRE